MRALIVILFLISCFTFTKGTSDCTRVINSLNFQLNKINYNTMKKQNFVYSAYSLGEAISSILFLLSEQAKQHIQKQIGLTHSNLVDCFSKLREKKKHSTVFKSANKIWLDKNVKVNKTRLRELTGNIGKIITVMDIRNNTCFARRTINSWVFNHTTGMIQNFLNEGALTSQSKVIVTNAIYFHGTWKFPFEKEFTSNRDFYMSPKEKIEVSTMANTLNVNYYGDKEFGKMVEIPYKGDCYAMVILLSNSDADLNKTVFNDAIKKMKKRKLKLFLPKFKILSKLELKQALLKMNLKMLFSKIDFAQDDIYFDQVLHQCQITVDEEGSEASAGTGVMSGRSMTQSFHVNKPFHFFIRNTQTNMILFSGYVVKPSWT